MPNKTGTRWGGSTYKERILSCTKPGILILSWFVTRCRLRCILLLMLLWLMTTTTYVRLSSCIIRTRWIRALLRRLLLRLIYHSRFHNSHLHLHLLRPSLWTRLLLLLLFSQITATDSSQTSSDLALVGILQSDSTTFMWEEISFHQRCVAVVSRGAKKIA